MDANNIKRAQPPMMGSFMTKKSHEFTLPTERPNGKNLPRKYLFSKQMSSMNASALEPSWVFAF